MEEIESSSLKELSKDSYEIITQKLCDKGANHNIKSVKEKVRGTKKIIYFLKKCVFPISYSLNVYVQNWFSITYYSLSFLLILIP